MICLLIVKKEKAEKRKEDKEDKKDIIDKRKKGTFLKKKIKKNKKKESTTEIIIYLAILVVVLISIIGFLHYLKEKKGILIFTNEKLSEISQDIENVLKKDLLSLGFTREYTQNIYYESKRKNDLKWNLCINKLNIPENITIDKCQELIYASIGKTKGKILSFSKEEDKKYLYLIFNIGVLEYQTHKIIFIKKKIPKIAIILDDAGNNLNPDLFTLDKNITFSILPHLPESKKFAHLAYERGHELMLHLPMEPHGYPSPGKDPGKEAIFIGISPEEIAKRVEYALKSFPYIKGVNNHMGSKATENKEVMDIVLKKIKKHNLYFIDSLTSSHSVVSKVAQEKNVPYAVRDIFIDYNPEIKNIHKQIKKIIRIAKIKGQAIGIGHAHSKNTLLALKNINSLLSKENVQLVPASMLVE